MPCHLYERLRDKGAEEGPPPPQRNTCVGAFGDFARAVGVSRAPGTWDRVGIARPPPVGDGMAEWGAMPTLQALARH